MSYRVYRSLPGFHVVEVKPQGLCHEAIASAAKLYWGANMTDYQSLECYQEIYPSGVPQGVFVFEFGNLRKAKAFMKKIQPSYPGDLGAEARLVASVKSPGRKEI